MLPSFRPLDCAGSTVRASVNYWAFPVAALFPSLQSRSSGNHSSGQVRPFQERATSCGVIPARRSNSSHRICQNRGSRVPARPRLPKPLPTLPSSNKPFGLGRQLAAQEVTETFRCAALVETIVDRGSAKRVASNSAGSAHYSCRLPGATRGPGSSSLIMFATPAVRADARW